MREFSTESAGGRNQPETAKGLFEAAVERLRLGDGMGAERLARRLVLLQPSNDRAHFLIANALCVQGRLGEALDPLNRALAFQPNQPDYVTGKAQILGRLGWSSQAIGWYRRALKLRPSPQLTAELTEILLIESLPVEAVSRLEQLPASERPPALMAQAYTEARQFERADPLWVQAETVAPNKAQFLLKRSTVETYAGRLDIAESLLHRAISIDPSASAAYAALATVRKLTPADQPIIAAMENLRATSDLGPVAQADLNYALGKAYQDLGEFKKAIQRYDDANRILYLSSPICKGFDPSAWRAYTDFLIEFFTPHRMRALAAEGNPTTIPLFIVGMIRSGTTLTEQMLTNHPTIGAGGETTFWPDHREEILGSQGGRFDQKVSARLAEEFLAMLTAKAPSCAYVTEKNPSNVMLTAMLHCIYPRARFLHIRRHPVDNLLSIWMTPIKTGLPFVYDRKNLVAAYRDYQRLAEHLDQSMPSECYRSFTYEQITSQPEPAVNGMLDFLGLEPEPRCLHPESNERTVRTPSFLQVRQPINTGSLQRWKRYEPWLGEFADLLEP